MKNACALENIDLPEEEKRNYRSYLLRVLTEGKARSNRQSRSHGAPAVPR